MVRLGGEAGSGHQPQAGCDRRKEDLSPPPSCVGGVREWLNRAVSKTVRRETAS